MMDLPQSMLSLGALFGCWTHYIITATRSLFHVLVRRTVPPAALHLAEPWSAALVNQGVIIGYYM